MNDSMTIKRSAAPEGLNCPDSKPLPTTAIAVKATVSPPIGMIVYSRAPPAPGDVLALDEHDAHRLAFVRQASGRHTGGGGGQELGQQRIFLAHGLVGDDGYFAVSRGGHEADDSAALEEAQDALACALHEPMVTLRFGFRPAAPYPLCRIVNDDWVRSTIGVHPMPNKSGAAEKALARQHHGASAGSNECSPKQ